MLKSPIAKYSIEIDFKTLKRHFLTNVLMNVSTAEFGVLALPGPE